MKQLRNLLLLASLLIAVPAFGQSAAVSNTVAVPVSLSLAESATLSVSPNSVTLTNLVPSQTVTLTAGWQVASGHTSATVYSWISALPSGTTQDMFSTQFAGGAVVTCNQTNFPNNAQIGISAQRCGTFTVPNIGTDLNDSQSISVAVALTAAANSLTVGSYTNGSITFLFEIV